MLYNNYLFFPIFFWLIAFTKKLFFWTWLWQLKEYHVGRFLDHFRTEKGKKIIFNSLNLAKLICLFGLVFFFSYFISILVLIFLTETLFVFYRLLKRNFRYPVFTKKTVTILATGLFLEIFFLILFWQKIATPKQFFLSLLILDLLVPIIFSILVLSFQPLVVFLRNRIIEKAKRKRETYKNLIVIGITGSYGKTSTKEFLANILLEKFNVLRTKEHQNSEVGISLCILNDLKPEHEIFVCEMGAYNRGGIKLLCDIAKPKIGILTGINEQHMATFGSQKNIIQAKLELIHSLPENGLAILNESDPKIKNLKFKIKNYNPRLKNIKFCSSKEKADVWAEDVKVEKEWISFKAVSRSGEGADLRLNLVGAQNIENLLMAICCAKELGMSFGEIARACQKIKPFEKTMELKKGRGKVQIIDDSYAANPQGVMAALDYLKIYPNKRIIIMPCLIELGKASKTVHQKIGEKIGKVCDLAIITTKDRFQEIKKGAIKSGMGKENILFLENPKEIFEKIKLYLPPSFAKASEGKENVVLLESRVPQELLDLLLKRA